MPLACGVNKSVTYNPTGDGFHPNNPGIAIALALADYGVSLARVVKRIARWDAANPLCPANCPTRTNLSYQVTKTTFKVNFNQPLRKWAATFGHDLTGIVECKQVPPAGGGGGGGTKGGKKGKRRPKR
jgi:hypothetical protein